MELRQNKTVWDSNLKLLSKAEVIIRRAEKNWIFTINIGMAEQHDVFSNHILVEVDFMNAFSTLCAKDVNTKSSNVGYTDCWSIGDAL